MRRHGRIFDPSREHRRLVAHLLLACLLPMVAGDAWSDEVRRASNLRVSQGEPSIVSNLLARLPSVEDAWPESGIFQLASASSSDAWAGSPDESSSSPSIPPVPSLPSAAGVGPGAPWHLLSVPDQPDSIDPAVLLPVVASNFSLAYAYDACDTIAPWRIYDPADLPASDLNAIDHRIGFWLKATNPDPLAVSGTEPAETSIQLCAGWNLIGYPLAQDRPVLAALSSIVGKFQRVYGFESATPKDAWKVYDVDAPDWANTLQTMARGKGYWVYATEDTTLVMRNVGPPPEVVISSPADGANIITFTDIIGSVRSDLLERWELAHRLSGESNFTTFATGDTPVANDVLTTFDPTLMLNGLYQIRLRATDFAGQSASTAIDVVLEGEQKIGHFTLPILDLEVPVVGVDFEVIRTYDSREKRNRDFGIGWTLGLSDFRVQENIAPGAFWRGERLPGLIPTYCIQPARTHIVVVTFPDGDVARFQPRISPQCQIAAPPQIVTVTYEPLAGTLARLDVLDVRTEDLLVVGSFPGPVELWGLDITTIHNPETYRLTAADGTEYVVDERAGLTTIKDPQGNVLTVSDTGINHSRGIGLTFERDAQNRIVRILDPRSNFLTYEYDAGGDLVRVIDQEEQVTTFEYIGDHYLETIITPDGTRIAAIEYDEDNRWTGTCNANNQCTRFTHDLEANREILLDASGRTRTYEYDDFGKVTRVTDGLGFSTRYEYGEFEDIDRIIEADGLVTEFTYENGEILSRIDPHPAHEPIENFTTSYEYDSGGRVTNVTYPTGAEYDFTYDATGNLLEQRDEAGNLLIAFTYGPGGVRTSESGPFGTYTFGDHDAFGNPRTQTNPFGVTTTSTFDAGGNLTTMQSPNFSVALTYDKLDRETRTEYATGTVVDASYGLGTLWTATDGPTLGRQERKLSTTGRLVGWNMPGNRETSFSRDPVGRLVEQANPEGNSHQFVYDAAGRLSSTTNDRGAEVSYKRDPVGRVLETTDPLGHTARFTYDEAGRWSSGTNARDYTWTTSYTLHETTVTDPLGRETSVLFSPHRLPILSTFPDGSTIETSYLLTSAFDDAQDYPTRIVDQGGNVRTFAYDPNGQLITASDLAANPTTYTYDPIDQNLLSMIGPTGLGRTFTYTPTDMLKTVTFPDGGVSTLTWGPRSTLDRKVRPSGTTVDFDYDDAFRPIGRTSSLGESAILTWNGDDSLAQTIDATGTTTYAYNGATSLEQIDYPSGGSVQYTRDLNERVLSITAQASPSAPAQVAGYGYDEVGNLTSIVDPLGGTTTMDYDAVNRLTNRTLPNGVTTTYSYDDRDQLMAVVHRAAGGAVISSTTYEREGIGEPRRVTREDGSYVLLEYDAALRLTEEAFHDSADNLLETITYTYDAAGNRQAFSNAAGAETYAYGQGFWLSSVTGPSGAETYVHDADGRLTSFTRDGETRGLEYDSLDQLLRVEDATGQELVRFAYDAQGRRTSVVDAAGQRSVLVAPTFSPALEHVHLIADPVGVLQSGYVYAGGQPLMRHGPDGPIYYLTDALGSVIGLTDASGAAVASFHYDGFGNIRLSSGSQASLDPVLGGDFRFHGEWLDAQTDLYHLRARYYDPQVGRLLSRDPVEPARLRPETLNDYAFAFSNPYLYSDPTGLFSLVEINISMSVSDIVAAIKTAAVQYARQTVKEKIGEVIGQAVADLLTGMLPLMAPSIASLTQGSSYWPSDQGSFFEWLVGDLICDFMDRFIPAAFDYIWFEVGVQEVSGQALNNGLFDCNGPLGSGPAMDPLNPKGPGRQSKRPDFIFSAIPPEDADKGFGGDKTFIIGDFKRSANAIGQNRGQFDAMIRHARHYGFHLAMFITMNGFKKRHPAAQGAWNNARRFALQNHVQVFVASLI